MGKFAVPKAFLSLLAAAALCGAQTYQPLFDGKSLKGWHQQGPGAWKAMDGMLVGTHTKDGDHGHLVTDSSFTDFRFHFQWKLSAGGNSGCYFHAQKGGAGGMIGAQLEMDESYSGGLYSTATNPWGFIYQTKAEDARKWYRPGDWNDVVLTVKGNRVTNVQNGFTTMDLTSDKLGKDGQFGFQLHAGLDMTLWLRNLEWSEVPGTTPVLADPGQATAGRKHPARLVRDDALGLILVAAPEGIRGGIHDFRGKRIGSGKARALPWLPVDPSASPRHFATSFPAN